MAMASGSESGDGPITFGIFSSGGQNHYGNLPGIFGSGYGDDGSGSGDYGSGYDYYGSGSYYDYADYGFNDLEIKVLLGMRKLTTWLLLYGFPMIYILGIPGNILTLIVLFSKTYGWRPSNINLVMLAITDTIVLIFVMVNHIWLNVGLEWSTAAECQWFSFVYSVVSPLSCLLLASTMVERAIAVSFPLKSSHLLTQKRILLGNLGIIGFLVAYYLPIFYFYDLQEDGKYVNCGYHYTQEHWADYYFLGFGKAILQNILPMIIIFVCVFIIICKIRAAKAQRSASLRARKGKKESNSTTYMLLAVAIVFLVSMIFQTVDELGFPLGLYDSHKLSFYEHSISTIGKVLARINNAVNFILYCATGTRFRRAFVSIFFGCCRKKKNMESTQSFVTTTSAV